MTTPHRTLQMALDALDAITDDVDGTGLNTMPSFDKAIDAIAALREALAAPQPEPWMHDCAALCTNDVELWIDACPHCGKPRAAPPAAPASQWMPIETAPKDVTILLYGAKRLEMCVGMHHSRDGWVTDTTSDWMSMYPPTHWMPLPAAPDHLRDVAEKAAPAAPVVPNECEKIFTHKWLDPDCIEQGCKSLAAPVVRELQDDLIESVMRDVAELDYSSPEGMPDVMLVTADELRGILQARLCEALAAPPAAPAPVAPVVREPRHVRKVGGSFEHTGAVVAEFKTTAGEPRIVLEFDAPVAGMLHVYRPDQVEPCEPAPVAREPLTDGMVAYLEQQAFASIKRTIERPVYQHWFREGVRAGYGITGGSNG